MELDLTYNEALYVRARPEDLAARGVPVAVIGAAAKAWAETEAVRFAEGYREALATTSPGKLAAYRVKEEIARDPSAAGPDELALIAREAQARGLTQDALIALIAAQATAYRQAALLVEVLETELKAAIAAIPDDTPNIAAEIATVLGAAKSQADAAFAEARALTDS